MCYKPTSSVQPVKCLVARSILIRNCRAIDLVTVSVFEAGRGNVLFLNANLKQSNQCEALIKENVDRKSVV